MRNSEYEVYSGSLYDYTAGVYCGVLVTKDVMRKLAKEQASHLEKVKKILTDGAEDDKVFPSNWTLHYPEGVQTSVRFIDTSADVKNRIKMAGISRQPTHTPLVFIADCMKQAKRMADIRYSETKGE